MTARRGRPRKGIFPAKTTNALFDGDEQLEDLPKCLLEGEIAPLLAKAGSTDDLIAFELMIISGLRVGEVAELRVGDISLAKGELTVRAEVAKRSKERRVPIDDRTCCEISVRIRELRLGTLAYLYPRKEGTTPAAVARTLQRRVESAAEDAGITRIPVHPHILRHTAITRMLERGIPIERVKEIVGHESIETTMIYTHVSTKLLISSFKEAFPI